MYDVIIQSVHLLSVTDNRWTDCIMTWAANPCPVLGGWSAYFDEFFDIGGMIPKKCFSTNFLQKFFLLKSKLLGGGVEVKYWGGMYPPSPRDLQPCTREPRLSAVFIPKIYTNTFQVPRNVNNRGLYIHLRFAEVMYYKCPHLCLWLYFFVFLFYISFTLRALFVNARAKAHFIFLNFCKYFHFYLAGKLITYFESGVWYILLYISNTLYSVRKCTCIHRNLYSFRSLFLPSCLQFSRIFMSIPKVISSFQYKCMLWSIFFHPSYTFLCW